MTVLSENGCLLWKGKVAKDGYGYMRVQMRAVRPHKLSFIISGGILTEDRPWVLHSCHTPLCVNPAHLHAGNHQENENEKVSAGRQARGEKIRNSKLSKEKVAEIRAQFATGRFTKQTLADKNKVSRQTIHKIIAGMIWNH